MNKNVLWFQCSVIRVVFGYFGCISSFFISPLSFLLILFFGNMSDDEMMFGILINDVQDAEEQEAGDRGRQFYPREDPIEVLSDALFVKHFRLDKNSFHALLEELNEIIPIPNPNPRRRRSALDLKTQLLVTLLFYAHGSYQAVTGSNIFAGMHQSSVCKSVKKITDALNHNHFKTRWLKFPQNMQELQQRKASFYNSTHFPGGIGVIDCTHIAIVAPSMEEHIYVNRKHYHSLNVQLICDEYLKIINVDASFPGSTHDAFIWSQSDVAQIMEQVYRRDMNNNFFLLGDSGYPLRPWISTPFRDALPGTAEENFNSRFKSVRSIIERCNGVLKNRFRCLLRHRVLHYAPEGVAKIVLACAILHNICIENQIEPPQVDDEILNEEGVIRPEEVPAEERNADLIAGRQLRRQIAQDLFVN